MGRALPIAAPAPADHWLDWTTSGGRALERARRLGRPVVVVVAPRWCAFGQRMQHTLMTDRETREQLARFEALHLDPDDDPDSAALLRRALVELTSDRGPSQLAFLDAAGRPFFAGGYFSTQPQADRPDVAALLRSVADTFAERPGEVDGDARALWSRIAEPALPEAAPADLVADADARLVDGSNDGPPVGAMQLLLARHRAGDARALATVVALLHKALRGGIHDHIGGGFHRAARDPGWIVPYFEKPLVTNARLAWVLAQAAAPSGDPALAEAAREAGRFATTLAAAGGGLRSAIAADKDYYGWTAAELVQCVPPEHLQAVGLHFNITPHPSKHALYAALAPAEMAGLSSAPADELAASLVLGKARMLAARQRRPAPAIDGRVLVAHNGIAIEALLRTAELTGDDEVRRAALAALAHVDTLAPARLDDFAHLALAQLAAHEVCGQPGSLARARELARLLLERFYDDGRLWSTAVHPATRIERFEDAPILPSPIAAALRLLLALARHGGDDRWRTAAALVAARAARAAARSPVDHGDCLWALAQTMEGL